MCGLPSHDNTKSLAAQKPKGQSAHKLSTVKKWQGPPSFRGQATQPLFPEKNKQGTKRGHPGKGAKRHKKQAIHFATTASHPPPVAHTIMHFTPQGLAQRIAVSDPSTSFFGHGPWSSFNNAMRTADAIGASKTPRTIQRLKQSLIDQIALDPAEWSPTSSEYLDYLHNIKIDSEEGAPTPDCSTSPVMEEWLN